MLNHFEISYECFLVSQADVSSYRTRTFLANLFFTPVKFIAWSTVWIPQPLSSRSPHTRASHANFACDYQAYHIHKGHSQAKNMSYYGRGGSGDDYGRDRGYRGGRDRGDRGGYYEDRRGGDRRNDRRGKYCRRAEESYGVCDV